MPVMNIDEMLTMLESATNETDKLSAHILNEEAGIGSSTIKKLSNIFISLASSYSKSNSETQIAGLVENVNRVRQIRPTDEYRVLLYPNMHKPVGEHCSLNIQFLFDYVVKEIDKHEQDPEKYNFDPMTVNRKAIAFALKQCTGKYPSKTLDLSGFKYHYQMSVFGGFKKINVIPKIPEIATNALKIPLILKFIDNKLIYRHITSLTKYQSDLLSKFAQIVKEDPSAQKRLSKYLDAVELAIKYTMNIYTIMRNTYFLYGTEYNRVIKYLIAKDEQLSNRSQNESCLIETAAFIAPNVKAFKSFSTRLEEGILNESTSEVTTEVSESLKSFLENFKTQTNKELEEHAIITREFQMAMGSTLMKLGDIKDVADQTYETYDKLNTLINVDEYASKFEKNCVFLNDIFKQYDKYKNHGVKFYIEHLLPAGLQKCVPEQDINVIGVLLSNISFEICGKYRYINPDIETMSKNIISIPILLGIIDSHIKNLVESICSKVDKIIVQDVNPSEQKEVIDSITNTYFVYLAILLNIYKNLSIIEKSALATVTAISEANNDSIS